MTEEESPFWGFLESRLRSHGLVAVLIAFPQCECQIRAMAEEIATEALEDQ